MHALCNMYSLSVILRDNAPLPSMIKWAPEGRAMCGPLSPEAPQALSLHWSRKIPLGPSLLESSDSQNFFPGSSCCRTRRERGESSHHENTAEPTLSSTSRQPPAPTPALALTPSPLPWLSPPAPGPGNHGSVHPWTAPTGRHSAHRSHRLPLRHHSNATTNTIA